MRILIIDLSSYAAILSAKNSTNQCAYHCTYLQNKQKKEARLSASLSAKVCSGLFSAHISGQSCG